MNDYSTEEEYIKPIFDWDENDSNEVLIKKRELQNEVVTIIKEFPWPYSKKAEVLEYVIEDSFELDLMISFMLVQ